jgi:hypothetical protein
MLILKQNAANTVPTPPAGKGTIFLNPSDDLAVKTADGNITVFPTAAGANTQVYFNDDGSFGATANFTFNKSTNVLTITGNITASNANLGNAATANFFIGSGNNLSNIQGANVTGAVATATTAGTVTTAAQPNITSTGTLTALTVTGTTTAGNLSTGGTLSVTGNANVGNLGTGGLITATGNVSGGNLTTAGVVVATGNISANFFIGNGSQLTGIDATTIQNGTANVRTFNNANVTVSASGNANVLVITGTGANIAGTLDVTGNANVGNLGTGGLIVATGNVSGGNLTTAGAVVATGNVSGGNLTTAGILSVTGTGVSSIAGNLDMTSNTIINLATPTSSTDAATKQYVDDVAQGLNIHPSCNAATTTTLATISGGTVTYDNGTAGVGATLTTTGTYTTIDGVTLSDGMRILVKNEVTQANNGIYVRTSATVLTRATDFDTAVEIAGGDFTFITAGTEYNSTGWVQIDEVTTVGTDPIVWEQFSGAGTYQAGTGLTLTGSTFSVNASQTQVTAVGTLTGLAVNGNITAANITANTGVFTGNGSALTALNASNVSSGTLEQARLANASVTLGSTALTLGSTVTTVAGLTSVTSTTFVGELTGAATTAGTVTTAAQGNITSVGTLTGLTLANAAVISVGSNTNVGTFTGNFSLSAGSRLNATYADLAEKYVADATHEPGTVLEFGGEFEVTLANTFDSTRVAGVVTTNPAYTMNNECEGEHVATIALQGRVPVKVSGTITKGDLLVSASNGHAVANNEARAGTIIGKSLENFTGESGVIEVAVGRF